MASSNSYEKKSFFERFQTLKRKLQEKHIGIPVILAAILLGIFLTLQQVFTQQDIRKGAFPGGAQLFLITNKPAVYVGDTIAVNVLIDTKEQQVTAANIQLQYPADKLELSNVQLSDFLEQEIIPIATEPGKISFGLGSQPESPKSGSGLLATVTFVARETTATPLTITFDPQKTSVSALDRDVTNVIDTVQDLTLSIKTLNPVTDGVQVTLDPSTTSPSIGNPFNVAVQLDTKSYSVTAAEFHLTYNPTELEFIDAIEGDALPNIVSPPLTTTTSSTLHTTTISVGSDPETPLSGTGTGAVYTFRVRPGISTTTIGYNKPLIKIASLGDSDLNVFGDATPLTITVGSTTPTTTPVTPTPSTPPSPTPTTPVNPTVTLAPIQYEARLTGSQEAPPNNSPATGYSTLTLYQDGSAYVSLSYTTLQGTYQAAHIHGPAPVGEIAGILFTLPAEEFSGHPITLSSEQMRDLARGDLYINVHSSIFPEGEIRGQYGPFDPNVTPTSPPPTNTPQPTPTIPPNATALNISIKIPTIGNNASIGENPSPDNPSRQVDIELYNGNALVKAVSGILTFNNPHFSGNIDIGNDVPNGTYTLRAKLVNSLKRNLGNVTVTKNITQVVPVGEVVMGDTNSDNILNVFDYNILVSCHGTRRNTPTCNNDQFVSDINDDGSIFGEDYSTLLRGLYNRVVSD